MMPNAFLSRVLIRERGVIERGLKHQLRARSPGQRERGEDTNAREGGSDGRLHISLPNCVTRFENFANCNSGRSLVKQDANGLIFLEVRKCSCTPRSRNCSRCSTRRKP